MNKEKTTRTYVRLKLFTLFLALVLLASLVPTTLATETHSNSAGNIIDLGGGNFVIPADDVTLIDTTIPGKNNMIKLDEGTYIFTDPSEEITSLTAGDKIIALTEDKWQSQAIEILEIMFDSFYATIVAAPEPDLYDFTSEVHIDTEVNLAILDMTDASPEVSLVQPTPEGGITPFLNISGSDEYTVLDETFTLADVQSANAKFNAELELKATAKVKVNVTPRVTFAYVLGIPTVPNGIGFNPCVINASIAYDMKLTADFEYNTAATPDKFNKDIKLADASFPILWNLVTLKTPLVVPVTWDASAEAHFEYTLTGEMGFAFDGKVAKPIKENRSTTDLKLDGQFKATIGLRLDANLVIGIDEKVLGVVIQGNITPAFHAYAGIELSGFLDGSDKDPNHYCKACVDGGVYLCTELSFDIKWNVAIGLKLSGTLWNAPIANTRTRLFNFHFSVINEPDSMYKGIPTFGFRRCRNRSFEIDYSKLQPIMVEKDNDADLRACAIDLYNETIFIAADYNVKAYSLDGGDKWKVAKADTLSNAKFPKLLNKGLTLHLSDKPIDKSTKKPEDGANIIRFEKIEKRPTALKIAANYALEEYQWALTEKGTTNKITSGKNIEVGLASGKTVDSNGYGELFSDYVGDKTGTKTTYFARLAPKKDASGWVPASKAAKVTVLSEIKAPRYKVTVKKKKEDGTTVKTVKVKANTCVNGKVYSEATVINVQSGDVLSIWSVPTAKKPASATQTLTVP